MREEARELSSQLNRLVAQSPRADDLAELRERLLHVEPCTAQVAALASTVTEHKTSLQETRAAVKALEEGVRRVEDAARSSIADARKEMVTAKAFAERLSAVDKRVTVAEEGHGVIRDRVRVLTESTEKRIESVSTSLALTMDEKLSPIQRTQTELRG